MAPTRSRGIQRLNMSSQLNARYPKRGGTPPMLSKPVYEESVNTQKLFYKKCAPIKRFSF